MRTAGAVAAPVTAREFVRRGICLFRVPCACAYGIFSRCLATTNLPAQHPRRRRRRRVPFGQQLLVVGSAEALGAWDTARGALMTWNEGDVWEVRPLRGQRGFAARASAGGGSSAQPSRLRSCSAADALPLWPPCRRRPTSSCPRAPPWSSSLCSRSPSSERCPLARESALCTCAFACLPLALATTSPAAPPHCRAVAAAPPVSQPSAPSTACLPTPLPLCPPQGAGLGVVPQPHAGAGRRRAGPGGRLGCPAGHGVPRPPQVGWGACFVAVFLLLVLPLFPNPRRVSLGLSLLRRRRSTCPACPLASAPPACPPALQALNALPAPAPPAAAAPRRPRRRATARAA